MAKTSGIVSGMKIGADIVQHLFNAVQNEGGTEWDLRRIEDDDVLKRTLGQIIARSTPKVDLIFICETQLMAIKMVESALSHPHGFNRPMELGSFKATSILRLIPGLRPELRIDFTGTICGEPEECRGDLHIRKEKDQWGNEWVPSTIRLNTVRRPNIGPVIGNCKLVVEADGRRVYITET